MLLLGGIALADVSEEHTVLLTTVDPQAELRDRLRTELTQGGWLVVELPSGTDAPSRVPDEVARQVHASVAMRIDEHGDVELWVVDPDSHATVHHESIDTEPAEGADVVSLRVVEVLRARLLKLGVSVPTAPGMGAREPEPAPSHEAHPNPEPHAAASPGSSPKDGGSFAPRSAPVAGASEQSIDLSASPLAAFSPGGLGLTPELGLQAHYVMDRRWAVGVLGVVPVGTASVEEQAGTVSVAWGFAGVSAERRFLYGQGGFGFGVSAGVVAQRLSGDAVPPYRAATDWITTAAFLGTVGTRFDLSETLRIRLDGSAGVAAPRPVVMIGEHRAASWGRPLFLLALGLEWEAWRSQR